jgi:hypothetical protein
MVDGTLLRTATRGSFGFGKVIKRCKPVFHRRAMGIHQPQARRRVDPAQTRHWHVALQRSSGNGCSL